MLKMHKGILEFLKRIPGQIMQVISAPNVGKSSYFTRPHASDNVSKERESEMKPGNGKQRRFQQIEGRVKKTTSQVEQLSLFSDSYVQFMGPLK